MRIGPYGNRTGVLVIKNNNNNGMNVNLSIDGKKVKFVAQLGDIVMFDKCEHPDGSCLTTSFRVFEDTLGYYVQWSLTRISKSDLENEDSIEMETQHTVLGLNDLPRKITKRTILEWGEKMKTTKWYTEDYDLASRGLDALDGCDE